MDYSFTSSALVFPAISLLMLAYTQRFLTLSDLVRKIHDKYLSSDKQSDSLKYQIENLKKRLKIIQIMQIFGAGAFTLAIIAMLVYAINISLSLMIFLGSLISLLISLGLLLYELQISVNALNIQLNEID